MITGTRLKMIRIAHPDNVHTVHEGPELWDAESIRWRGRLVATRSADLIWRYYSSESDTSEWPVVGPVEAMMFSDLPEYII